MTEFSQSEFTKTVDEYSNTLYRIAFQRTLNDFDSQDVVQDTFIELYRNGNDFDNQQHLKAWLIRVAINKCNDLNRSAAKKTVELSDNLAEQLSEHQFGLFETVATLKPDYRDVIYLYYYEGYSVPEIAIIKKKRINTVNSQLQRARKKLKGLLGGVGNG